ncbi:hypothetical protein LCGC14_2702040 [marine sediment metagenome]|uniref:Uncharacterized protein n=1 Tax=marine sediment metagenome TaxID=412755 RepID=A0A0F9A324_9ZZZZ
MFESIRRYWFRRDCRQAGIDPEFAERLNEVGQEAAQAGRDVLDICLPLMLQGYRGEALLMEIRRQVANTPTPVV